MKSWLFPRMPSWLKAIFIKRQLVFARQGTLYFLPLFLIFFFLAISILMLTQTHLKLGGIRTQLALSNLAAENGLKMGYLFLWEKAEESNWPILIDNLDWQLLMSNPDDKLCSWLLSRMLGLEFPFFMESSWENMNWKTDISLNPKKIQLLFNYVLAEIQINFKAKGKIKTSPLSSLSHLVVESSLVAGYLPLTFFPLLIESKISPEEQSNYLKSKKIELAVDKKMLSTLKPYFTQGEMISRRTIPFLEKGLKIKLFETDRINPLILRHVLGLEENQEPVPEGVYLIKDDLGLGGVFVQGNLDELLLAIEDGYQVMSFRQLEKNWELRFSPSLNQTVWITPEKSFVYDTLPNEIVLINGNILSFGGKNVEDMTMMSENPPPSILPGIKLSFVTSGHINITSPLFQPNLEILPGIPYAKKKQSQIIIFSTGKDLITGEEKEASIVIDPGKRKEMIIEANLSASDKGVIIKGTGNEVIIKGGIQTAKIENQSSTLKIIPPTDLSFFLKTEELVPLTQKPLAALVQLKPIEWRENERIYSD